MSKESFSSQVWKTLSAIDVSKHVEKKGNLSYLSWAWAWGVLMEHYPDSQYCFEDPVYAPDNTCEIWCVLSIDNGQDKLTRRMWLPVMDYKNNSIQNPTTRHINDTRMRCLTKCMAMCGLGHYIYAGEDLPEGAKQGRDLIEYNKVVKAEFDSIYIIKESMANDDYASAKAAWNDLSEETKKALWLADSKGGIFTTEETSKFKSNEWSNA